ncbi:MAG TPA: acetyltransferase [Rhizobium sp.]|nr:acetyltransferase [Rhizobium sp.]
MPLLNKDALHPITLPTGALFTETVQLQAAIDHPRIEVGEYSYFTHSGAPEETASILAPYLSPFSREKLVIGRFAQIARGTTFITSSANHPMTGVTSYPFRIFNPDTMMDYAGLPYKDTTVGHDVWIGHSATIMPGVTIGHGAIIASAAVVTRDVPPYAIVGGNPASLIRMRFSGEAIADLLEIAWWDWPIDKIEANLPALECGDLAALRAAS